MSDTNESVAVPTDTVGLPSGAAIPLLGFGTWQLRETAADNVATALATGYRHLDTAAAYRNEREVGQALADSGVAREDVFVTTKYAPSMERPEIGILRRSLDQLGTDHVDLWLVHAPGDSDARNVEMWEAFVQAQADGLARDIGVSNFSLDQVDAVTAATGVAPAVNQVEWRPALHDAAVLDGHRSRGVVVEGYSGLQRGQMEDPVVQRIVDETGRTAAQVIIRWHLQHGIVVIPRSSKAERIRANADVGGFTLTDEQMAGLDALGG